MIKLVEVLKEKTLKITFAESITGGRLASEITKISGASLVYQGSIVCYSKELKSNLLNVSLETINKYSVVSKEVAKEMVLGLKNIVKSDLYIATTGNAGPGLEENTNSFKAYYAIGYKEEVKTFSVNFSSNERIKNINYLVTEIINKILEILKDS